LRLLVCCFGGFLSHQWECSSVKWSLCKQPAPGGAGGS
jgi:hypothetical protein